MFSIWEQEALLRFDVIIIGAGIIGLSAAIELAGRKPQLAIAVLERGPFSSGASTRNAGFACFGSLTEIVADIERVGAEGALAVIDARRAGLELLRQRVGDANLQYEPFGGYELLFPEQLPALDRLDEINTLLEPMFGDPVFRRDDGAIARFGFNQGKVAAVLFNPFEGQIHSGAMVAQLMRLATERGVRIITGATVLSVDDGPETAAAHCQFGTDHTATLTANELIVCTNAFTPTLLPDVPIVPGRGQVLVTSPIPELTLRGAFHFDEGFYYFRNLGNRVLFGGGRNLAFQHEETHASALNHTIQTRLEELLRTVILPNQEFQIEHRWAGIMGFSSTKLPIVQRVGQRITVGFGCNGMGVALGSSIAQQVAELVMQG
ncbi:MAG: FAD-binding oxidoreductase [Chlorobi bacterium CHB2]|nr:FAD-binding oxidoreductase [Chlorobi bacterium CHB2]